jgi:hypothetical protein
MQKVQIIILVTLSLLGILRPCDGQVCANTALTEDCNADKSTVVVSNR